MTSMNYIASFILIGLGIYCMAVKKNLIKICIGSFRDNVGTPLRQW